MIFGGKATFIGIDGPAFFQVQYNPREFTVDKAVTWQEAETNGQGNQPLQFQKGSPMTATMELIFDTTSDDSILNVQIAWVNRLIALTNPSVDCLGGEQKNLKKQRPPALLFSWGTFTMNCVIESVNVQYLMFASTGEAIRAKCTVKLKEWVTTQTLGFGLGGGFGNDRADLVAGGSSPTGSKVVEVQGGQTLSQVAAIVGTTAQVLAAMNGISDPLADLTGLKLAVP